MGPEPAIYLIGEQHTNEDHAQAQAGIVMDLEPDVVLREGFNDQGWDQIQDDVERIGQTYSLDRLEDTLADEYGIETGLTDDTYDYIAETPWPDLEPADVLTLAEKADDQARDLVADGYAPDEEPVTVLETAADKYRLYHDVMQSPSSTAVHRTMRAVHDLRQDGVGTEMRGCDIDKEGYVEGMTDAEMEETFFSDDVIAMREQVMADRIGDAADHNDLVVGIIGRYHHRGVEQLLEEDGFDVDGGIMPGDSGVSDAYEESVIAQYD
jgi:hypothetical protein